MQDMPLAKDLKKGDKIVYDGIPMTVEKVDVSKIAKHGKAKCRIEAIDAKRERKIFITLSDQEIQLQ